MFLAKGKRESVETRWNTMEGKTVMNPFKGAVVALLLIALSIAVFGCTTLKKQRGRPVKPEPAPAVKGLESPKAISPRKEYDLHALLVPVIQYKLLISSADSFAEFVENGSGSFSDYIYRIFTLQKDGFEEGQGIVLTSFRKNGAIYVTVDRSLLKQNTDGSQWWQIQMNITDKWVFCELLISDLNAPLEIRYINPDTGKKYKTVPLFAAELEESLKEFSRDELKQMMMEDRQILIEEEYQKLFQNPIAIGEETVSTGAGEFAAVHIRDRGKEVGSMNDYWISSRVPGHIVKIERRNPDDSIDVIELTGITEDNISQISSEAVQPTNPSYK